MKKIILGISLSIVFLNIYADFIVRNDSDALVEMAISVEFYNLSTFCIEHNTHFRDIGPYLQTIFEIDGDNKDLTNITCSNLTKRCGNRSCTSTFKIPSKNFGHLLMHAKKYKPTIIVTIDPKTHVPIINIPQDEKALKEAIEKESAKQVSKKVKEAVPHLPGNEQGVGGVTGIVGEYAAQLEEE